MKLEELPDGGAVLTLDRAERAALTRAAAVGAFEMSGEHAATLFALEFALVPGTPGALRDPSGAL